MYIKINGSDIHYNANIIPFKTQHGNHGIRVIGDMPETDKGFKSYGDDDKVISDFSDYTYLYGENEYTKVQETKESASISFQPIPPSSYDKLSSRVSQVSSQVSAITPLTMSKDVYVGDTECEFDLVKGGNISAWLVTNDAQTPCVFEVIDNKIKVLFDELDEIGTVNISIQ